MKLCVFCFFIFILFSRLYRNYPRICIEAFYRKREGCSPSIHRNVSGRNLTSMLKINNSFLVVIIRAVLRALKIKDNHETCVQKNWQKKRKIRDSPGLRHPKIHKKFQVDRDKHAAEDIAGYGVVGRGTHKKALVGRMESRKKKFFSARDT